jgi:hypothetical protein
MIDPRPANINPALHRFTYQSTRAEARFHTTFTERSVPGAITGYGDGFGNVIVNQSVSTVTDKTVTPAEPDFYAVFHHEEVGTLQFRVGKGHYFRPGACLYLWTSKHVWLYQEEDMPAPRVIFGDIGARGFPAYPGTWNSVELDSEETQLNLKAALFPFRDFLMGINKNTPKSFLSVERLQEILVNAKSDAATSYNQTVWPKWDMKLSGFARLLAPILKYGRVPAGSKFSPNQTVAGQINKRWLSLGFAAGTIGHFVFGLVLAHSLVRALGLNEFFWMMTFTGWFLKWIAFVATALMGLAVFMQPAIKRPFRFDEDSFFAFLNMPYHQNATLGFTVHEWPKDHKARHFDNGLLSDKKIADNNIDKAHEECNFHFRSFAELVSKLSATKLDDAEKAKLLNEISNYKLPF